jgi:pantoate--beta-alanine ligase
MRTIRTIAEMRAWLGNCRAENRSVGLVPTMGAFHAGHHSLMRAAKDEMDEVVVSLFVNPAQFNDAKDLQNYPRSEANDAVEAGELGVDVLFAPPTSEIYPEGFATTVSVGGLSEVLEGAERGPGHFAGVCTVVCKLLNIIAPDAAYFGQKDAQQVAVVKRMVRDLDIPSKIEVLPTVREPDGLALSSRNAYLSPGQRPLAAALQRALAAGAGVSARGPEAVLSTARAVLDAEPRIDIDYLELRDPDLGRHPQAGRARLLIAARLGTTRPIDNVAVFL